MRHLILLLVLIPALALAANEPQSLRPEQLYHNYCSVCHGDKGNGQSHATTSLQPPPRDFTAPEAALELTRERMIHSVTHGVPGTAMAGWETQLSPAQIAAVVDYVRKTFMPDPDRARRKNRGREIYAHTCSVCHGDQGNSAKWGSSLLAKRPRDFTSAASRRELTRERMIHSVTHGVPGTPMVGFASQLSPADIAAVVDYIRDTFMRADTAGIAGAHAQGKPHGTDKPVKPAREKFPEMGVITQPLIPESEKGARPKPVDMRAPLPDGLEGDPVAGKALYIQNCVPCHGIAGNGEGPRAYFIFPRPRNFTRDYSRAVFNRPRLYHAISEGKVGTEMPAWSRALTPQQIADLSEYVFEAFIHPKEKASTVRR